MARKSYLILRSGRWSYNRAFPKDVWPVVGRSPFRLALGTDSMEEAQRRRGAAEQRYWAAVDEARKKLGEDRPRALSDVEAVTIVSRWFAQRNAELDHSHLHQPTPGEGRQEAMAGNEYSIHYATERLKMSDVEKFAPLAARVLAAEGVNADTASQGYRTLLQLLVRANKELAAIDLARLQGDFGYMGLLASAFEWAVKEQWLKANPVSGLTVTDDVDAADMCAYLQNRIAKTRLGRINAAKGQALFSSFEAYMRKHGG